MARVSWNKGITKYEPKPCRCGCGRLTVLHRYPHKDGRCFSYQVSDFIRGHEKRGAGGFNPEFHAPRLCACGCGMTTIKFRGHFNGFVRKHENIRRVPWNKGKNFSDETRGKMSLMRRGKEPSNKMNIDLGELRVLYVRDRKNALEVSRELDVSYDAVKNRLQSLGWSRSTKESCTTRRFREQMRQLRIKTLTSQPVIASPNKLEQLVYHTLDSFDVSYERQVPLFGKFVVDVLFPKQLLVVEIFGRYWHEMSVNKKKDYSKKKYLEKCGYNVEELWDDEIKRKGVRPVLADVLQKYQLI